MFDIHILIFLQTFIGIIDYHIIFKDKKLSFTKILCNYFLSIIFNIQNNKNEKNIEVKIKNLKRYIKPVKIKLCNKNTIILIKNIFKLCKIELNNEDKIILITKLKLIFVYN